MNDLVEEEIDLEEDDYTDFESIESILNYTDKSTLKTMSFNNLNEEDNVLSVPANLLDGYVSLNKLNVSYNNLDKLPDLPESLQLLDCDNNAIEILPETLPPNLITLFCSNNQITILPEDLPPTLEKLVCYDNMLKYLPELPEGLQILNCSDNEIDALPDLPESLKLLNCNDTEIDSLPDLPEGLLKLYMSNTNIQELPKLPKNLKVLIFNDNDIDEIPELPETLIELNCDNNQIKSLPELPDTLLELYCVNNILEGLPELPDNLLELYCNSNYLKVLPELPQTLQKLDCSYNNIEILPTLPPNLIFLFCSNTNIEVIPELPKTLLRLIMVSTQVEILPELSPKLEVLNFTENKITVLQDLPESLKELYCSNNNLKFLLPLPENLKILKCEFNDFSDYYRDNVLHNIFNFSERTSPSIFSKLKLILKEIEERQKEREQNNIFEIKNKITLNGKKIRIPSNILQYLTNRVFTEIRNITIRNNENEQSIPESLKDKTFYDIMDGVDKNIADYLNEDKNNIIIIDLQNNSNIYGLNKENIKLQLLDHRPPLVYKCNESNGILDINNVDRTTLYVTQRSIGISDGYCKLKNFLNILSQPIQIWSLIIKTGDYLPSTVSFEIMVKGFYEIQNYVDGDEFSDKYKGTYVEYYGWNGISSARCQDEVYGGQVYEITPYIEDVTPTIQTTHQLPPAAPAAPDVVPPISESIAEGELPLPPPPPLPNSMSGGKKTQTKRNMKRTKRTKRKRTKRKRTKRNMKKSKRNMKKSKRNMKKSKK